MIVRVLGTAAGGGVPQWNCGCANCAAARSGKIPRRLVASLAVSSGAGRWVLLNATVDICRQLELLEGSPPSGGRSSPIAAIFLTDANIDHVGGLLELRQAEDLRIFSATAVREMVAGTNRAFTRFADAPNSWATFPLEVDRGSTIDLSPIALRVRAIEVPGLAPSYASAGPAPGCTVAYVIEDDTEARLVYAPIFLEFTAVLARETAWADAAFFDGTFWTDDELPQLGLGGRRAREMGHAPIFGPGGSLGAVRTLMAQRRFYTHVNNSNPILDPDSQAAQALKDSGIEIAEEGMELRLSGSHRRLRSAAV